MAATGKRSGSILISPSVLISLHITIIIFNQIPFQLGNEDRPKVLCLHYYVYDIRQDCVAAIQATEAEAQSQGRTSVDVISFLNVSH